MIALRNAIQTMLTRAVEAHALVRGEARDAYWTGYRSGLSDVLSVMDARVHPVQHGEPHIVIAGTPTTGFQHHGPFDSWQDAQAWGEHHATNQEFWIAPLTTEPASGIKLISNRED